MNRVYIPCEFWTINAGAGFQFHSNGKLSSPPHVGDEVALKDDGPVYGIVKIRHRFKGKTPFMEVYLK